MTAAIDRMSKTAVCIPGGGGRWEGGAEGGEGRLASTGGTRCPPSKIFTLFLIDILRLKNKELRSLTLHRKIEFISSHLNYTDWKLSNLCPPDFSPWASLNSAVFRK